MADDSFQAWSNATQMPPHAANIDAPEQLPPEITEPPKDASEKPIERPVYQDKIVYKDKIIEKPIYKDKVIEKKKYITKDFDITKPLMYGLYGLLLLLLLFLGLWVWNYKFNTKEVIKEKIVEVPSKTKISIKYKTKWKTKEKVVYKNKYVPTSDTKELLRLKAEIIRLNRKITLLNRNNIELHKMTVRKFFKDPRRKSIQVKTRQY